MKKVLFILLVVSLLLPVQGEEAYVLSIKTPDIELKVTSDLITQLSYNETSLEGKVFTTTLDRTAREIADLWKGFSGDEIEVQVSYGMADVSGSFDRSESTELADYVDSLLARLIGHGNVWATDIEVAVLESYPEQYSASAVIQRGSDLLAVVVEQNVTLAVWNSSDVSDGLPTADPIYTSTTKTYLPSGGDHQVLQFDTFSLGEIYRPENLVFGVLVGGTGGSCGTTGGSYLVLSDSFEHGMINGTVNLCNTLDTQSLPYPAYVAPAVIAAVLQRRRTS